MVFGFEVGLTIEVLVKLKWVSKCVFKSIFSLNYGTNTHYTSIMHVQGIRTLTGFVVSLEFRNNSDSSTTYIVSQSYFTCFVSPGELWESTLKFSCYF